MVPLRHSERLRKIPCREGNVYGESRHPLEIERDISTRTSRRWSSWQSSPPRDELEGFNEPETSHEAPATQNSDEEVEAGLKAFSTLAEEGGVQFLNYLLAKAVPHDS